MPFHIVWVLMINYSDSWHCRYSFAWNWSIAPQNIPVTHFTNWIPGNLQHVYNFRGKDTHQLDFWMRESRIGNRSTNEYSDWNSTIFLHNRVSMIIWNNHSANYDNKSKFYTKFRICLPNECFFPHMQSCSYRIYSFIWVVISLFQLLILCCF